MSSPGFFEAHITTHQQGSSEIDYRAVHRHMAAHGFDRVLQTTAQKANEVPGIYRLHNPQRTMAEVVELIRLSLAPLGGGVAVQVLKIDEEVLLNLNPSASGTRADLEPRPDQPLSSGSKTKAQSGYPVWRRPR